MDVRARTLRRLSAAVSLARGSDLEAADQHRATAGGLMVRQATGKIIDLPGKVIDFVRRYRWMAMSERSVL